jgi:hypothetical protein
MLDVSSFFKNWRIKVSVSVLHSTVLHILVKISQPPSNFIEQITKVEA